MLVAFGVGALTAAACAVFSCFLILKGWSLMGDAISHAVLPGIVLAYLVGLPLALGAFASGFLCAVTTGFVKENSRLKEDTIMGVVFTGFFAFGLVLFTKVRSDQHLNHILFGSLLGISNDQVFEVCGLAGAAMLTMLLLRKDLLLYCFDSSYARSIGLNARWLHYLLLSLLALTIVASLQAVGVILVISMLITPGATGFLLTQRFSNMLVISVCTAVSSSLIGVYLSFFLDASTSASIVLIQSTLFLIVLILKRPSHRIAS
jgi:ABC-type Mn2+/Zn2+ transport system permease subunit